MLGVLVNAAQLLSPELLVVYDLSDCGAWDAACRPRAAWGRLYTDAFNLDHYRIALLFRSAGERWRPWERVRLGWILEELQESAAA